MEVSYHNANELENNLSHNIQNQVNAEVGNSHPEAQAKEEINADNNNINEVNAEVENAVDM